MPQSTVHSVAQKPSQATRSMQRIIFFYDREATEMSEIKPCKIRTENTLPSCIFFPHCDAHKRFLFMLPECYFDFYLYHVSVGKGSKFPSKTSVERSKHTAAGGGGISSA